MSQLNLLASSCFEKIKGLREEDKIAAVIDEFYPILLESVNPFSQPSLDETSNGLKKQFYEQDFVVPFVPSPDLVKSYQESFSKTQGQQKIPIMTNFKLKSLFENPAPRKNIQQKGIRKPIIDQNGQTVGYIGNHIEGRRVFIQEREQTMLDNLIKNRDIEATIPIMEGSLLDHEIGNLYKKDIAMQNMASLDDWRKMRNKITGGL